eukprot:CAMPEP_0170906894 /NCGR_PEP_ID=MMETSP0735-20130129/967_1 /TAXON_ID=186038 /ORGANISM="Fragilariopsis kerguelensis, Strain L26-C5" /LENGTH=151 /DNA_ID=CAMNT_0011302885 /DNA_START=114 /DNA_END=566 /DNA_ORIENTATION=-
MSFEKRRRQRLRLVPVLFCLVALRNDNVAADHLRNFRIKDLGFVRERKLPCSSELKEVESKLESSESLLRHRSNPVEHNIFIRQSQTTASPSELPSTLPTVSSTSMPTTVLSPIVAPTSTSTTLPTVSATSTSMPTTVLSPIVAPTSTSTT